MTDRQTLLTDSSMTEEGDRWMATFDAPARALAAAREGLSSYGPLPGFPTSLARFEAAVRTDAANQALTAAADHLEQLVPTVKARAAEDHGNVAGLADFLADFLQEVAAVVRERATAPAVGPAEEDLRVRLWLIQRALEPIDVQQDPAGITGMIGPYLDGPIHPTDTAAYRAARATGQA